jgi:hypothetical protein
MQSWTKNKILSAEKAPVLFFYPYVRLLLYKATREIARSRLKMQEMMDPNLAEYRNADLNGEEEELFNMSNLAGYLTESLASFENLTSLYADNKLHETVKMTSDFRRISHEATRLKESTRDCVHRRAAIWALEESRKSIQWQTVSKF